MSCFLDFSINIVFAEAEQKPAGEEANYLSILRRGSHPRFGRKSSHNAVYPGVIVDNHIVGETRLRVELNSTRVQPTVVFWNVKRFKLAIRIEPHNYAFIFVLYKSSVPCVSRDFPDSATVF